MYVNTITISTLSLTFRYWTHVTQWQSYCISNFSTNRSLIYLLSTNVGWLFMHYQDIIMEIVLDQIPLCFGVLGAIKLINSQYGYKFNALLWWLCSMECQP